MSADNFDAIKAEYLAMGGLPSNLRYGWCQAGKSDYSGRTTNLSATGSRRVIPTSLPGTALHRKLHFHNRLFHAIGPRRPQKYSRLGPASR